MLTEHRVERLKLVLEDLKGRGYKTYASIERDHLVSASYLSQIINGNRTFGENAARNFEKKLGLSKFYFDRGAMLKDNTIDTSITDDMRLSYIKLSTPTDIRHEDSIKVAIYSNYRSDSDGNILFGKIARIGIMSAGFFDKHDIDPNYFKMFIANGKSMEPFINEGDEVGVMKNETTIKDAEIYAITLDGDMMITQIFKEAGGALRLHSLNSTYPDRIVSKEYLNSLKVLGKQIYRAG